MLRESPDWAQINWPFKGEDYEANVLIDTLDFATIHSYPGDPIANIGQLICMYRAHLLCAPHDTGSGVPTHNSMLAREHGTFQACPAFYIIHF